MWNIFEQPWTGLVLAIVLFNVLAVVRWFVPLDRKWQYGPPIAMAVLALALCYLVDTDKELVHRVMSRAIAAVRQQKASEIDKLTSPDYSDPAHPDKKALMRSWDRWLGQVSIEHVGTNNAIYDLRRGEATVTFNWLVKFGPQRAGQNEAGGMAIFGVARVKLVETPRRKWLIQSSELLELMNRPTSWQRVDF
jgi:hypothetical protein